MEITATFISNLWNIWVFSILDIYGETDRITDTLQLTYDVLKKLN